MLNRRMVAMMAAIGAMLASVSAPSAADVREFKGSRVVKATVGKGRSVRREPQVTAVGGRGLSRGAYARLASRRSFRPSFTPVRLTPVRVFPEETFGVQLINGNGSNFQQRYGGYVGNNGTRGIYRRNRSMGGGGVRGGQRSFHGVAP
jgi:hypothetical protein